MESACEVNPTPNKDNCESQSLKNQGNIHGGWFFLFHQSSKPESTITSKNIEFERIESQDYCGRRSKIITRDGMLKVALSTFLILLIISLSIFLVMKHVTKNHDPEYSTLPTNASSSTSSPEELSSTMHYISTTDKRDGSIESETLVDANLNNIQTILSGNNFEIVEVAEVEISNQTNNSSSHAKNPPIFAADVEDFSKTMTNQDAMLKSKHAEDKLSIHNIQNNNETVMVIPAAEANELATEAAIGPDTEPTKEPATDPAIGPRAGANIFNSTQRPGHYWNFCSCCKNKSRKSCLSDCPCDCLPGCYEVNQSNTDDVDIPDPAKPEVLKSSYSMPTILSKPSNQEINKGDTIEMHCLVDNLDGFTPIWNKDNSTISIGTFLFNDQNNRIKLEQVCNGRAGPWFSNAKFVEIFRPF